jgi:hypothetical protein
MNRKLAGFALALSIAAMLGLAPVRAQDQKQKGQGKQLPSSVAMQLAALSFDGGAPVTIRGRVTTLFFGTPGPAGMMGVDAIESSDKYVFSTAQTKDMAKQGFSRYTLSPGEEVLVTGVLAKDGQRFAGFIAARADIVMTTNGRRIFDRATLPK